MLADGRLESLAERHARLEARLHEEERRPRPDAETVARIKREKLRLKDEIERLRHATVAA